MNYKDEYQQWLTSEVFDEETKAELKAIEGDEKEIEDRFYQELEFGTAGLRGVIGAGTNRMNQYTVGKATQGLANYILKQCDEMGKYNGDVPSVAIACDSRHMSPEFSDLAARILSANGIKAYIFESLRPTPELSFAVRYKKCIAGINITASHNPSNYNGYKVYWEDGAQITPPHDSGIMSEVNSVDDYSLIKLMTKEEAMAAGLYVIIGEEVDDKFIEAVKSNILNQEAIDKVGDEVMIVYTPLHGTGNIPVRRVLKEIGFKNVFVVPEQEKPNGDFPTCPYPNPETEQPFELGFKLAKEKNADLLLATDPDADRLGVYVRDNEGEYHPLTGNMSGCLLAYYEIEQKKNKGMLKDDSYIVETIVTSKMAKAAADLFGIETKECLTGFKNIGRIMLESEQSGKGDYVFGFEESYGCLIGMHARDKDAVVASMALCEAAAYYKTQGKTLWEALLDMYEKLGYYKESTTSVTLAGAQGADQIKAIMNNLRNNSPQQWGEYKVVKVRDYDKDTILDVATGNITPTGLSKSNVIYFDLENDAWICVRPSGTEPKIKFYVGIKGESLEDADKKCEEMSNVINAYVDEVTK